MNSTPDLQIKNLKKLQATLESAKLGTEEVLLSVSAFLGYALSGTLVLSAVLKPIFMPELGYS